MRKLEFLFLHCSATPEGKHYDKEDVIRWHMTPKKFGGRGWDRPGYRSIVLLDGTIQRLRPANRDAFVQSEEITWGAGPAYNGRSHHICYIGGMTADNKKAKDTRTSKQIDSLIYIIEDYLSFAPDVKVIGHNQVANKACPSFWVPTWLREIGLPEKNIATENPFGYDKVDFSGY